MNRSHRSQLKDIVLQLTALKATLEKIRWEAADSLSTHEDISTARTVADIEAAIKHLIGVM